jgi:hypothetical protein
MKKQRYDVDYLLDENRRLIAKLREFQAPIPPRDKARLLKKPPEPVQK